MSIFNKDPPFKKIIYSNTDRSLFLLIRSIVQNLHSEIGNDRKRRETPVTEPENLLKGDLPIACS